MSEQDWGYSPEMEMYGGWDQLNPGQNYEWNWGNAGDTGWLENALGTVGKKLSMPNTWNAILGLGSTLASALGSKNKTPSYSYSPYQNVAAGGLMGMANTSPFNQATIDSWLRMAQNSNVAAGLAPSAASGTFRNTLSNTFAKNALQEYLAKSGVWGQLGSLGSQGIAQQAAPSPWATALQTINQLDQQEMMKKLLSSMSGGTNLSTSPFLSNIFSLFSS